MGVSCHENTFKCIPLGPGPYNLYKPASGPGCSIICMTSGTVSLTIDNQTEINGRGPYEPSLTY